MCKFHDIVAESVGRKNNHNNRWRNHSPKFASTNISNSHILQNKSKKALTYHDKSLSLQFIGHNGVV